ncbi:hypothetical protein RO3G_05003 [Rhizopus delemar RA 99-880]|uniref:Uncharacterized protein n=1 Tax=Rhizopus delemar (strain RA 99-880 / ATCC MYA-4621 / FGSC 9543 / NRRL 43880) TaxID=246409 RepID=I1BVR8_RHIO9|nr:hypothetical protein RO3G_05003 [Rhizopus delemar RA 99-880]|eukprot:EIE80298.1 hypothetical protein RO3G_05003 [Rhizopus delemar RA 99-880]
MHIFADTCMLSIITEFAVNDELELKLYPTNLSSMDSLKPYLFKNKVFYFLQSRLSKVLHKYYVCFNFTFGSDKRGFIECGSKPLAQPYFALMAKRIIFHRPFNLVK